ncbi:Carbonic anhydrase [Diplonema papillatum]|nr:Carbonic anhydrase [Diplonema papillatum]
MFRGTRVVLHSLQHPSSSQAVQAPPARLPGVQARCRCSATEGDDRDLDAVIKNNREWVTRKNETDPDFFKVLGQPQQPKYLYIGCSDARVDPGQLMGLRQAELFVHRNVGNLCPNDLNFLSVLEYAVDFLEVPHIIVCGHYDCGAVRNSAKTQDIGLLENWIRHVRDVRRLHDDELGAIEDEEKQLRRLVELNVKEQCLNVFKSSCVQKHRARTSDKSKYPFATPRVHAMVFDPADGVLQKLDINFKQEVSQLRHVYDLI